MPWVKNVFLKLSDSVFLTVTKVTQRKSLILFLIGSEKSVHHAFAVRNFTLVRTQTGMFSLGEGEKNLGPVYSHILYLS